MNKWIAEFELEDGDTMPEHMDLEYKGVRIDFHCKPLEQEPCEDTISRKSIKQKLQEHHDFFVNAYGGFSNLPQNDKSRVDEITNCIAMVVNEPPVTPQEPRWIPVSERLPKAGEYIGNVERYYLVQNEYGDMLVARYTHSEYWEQIYQLKPIGDEIVAWKSLPQPYKAESEEL